MNPISEALAFRIWAYASPRGWNVTIPELSEVLGASVPRIRGVLVSKKWIHRVRKVWKTFSPVHLDAFSDEVNEAIRSVKK